MRRQTSHFLLKLHLCSEADDNCTPRAPSHVRVILDHRLEEEHRQNVKQSVELDPLLGLIRGHARWKKLRTQIVSYITERHGVVKVHWQRLIEAQPYREQSVVAVDIRRTPVVGKRRIQPLPFLRINSPKGLACHPIQEVVTPLRRRARGRREPSGIVGGAELIEARVSLAALDVVKGPHGRRPLARSKADLISTQWSSVELRNQAGRVL